MCDFRFQDAEVDWNRPQEQVKEQIASLQISVLDLLPIFGERSDRDQLYLREDTHFAALGHQVVADALAKFLQQTDLLPGS